MKKDLIFATMITMAVMAVMMISMTSCTGYSDELDEMLEEIEPQPDEDPDEDLIWTNVLQKYHRVNSDATVVSTMIGQKQNGELDTLSIQYNFVYELCSDTTIMLDEEPAEMIATAQDEISEFSEFFTNEQKDSVCYITCDKQYNLSNNIDFSYIQNVFVRII
jgi:hypothetical protein